MDSKVIFNWFIGTEAVVGKDTTPISILPFICWLALAVFVVMVVPVVWLR